MHIGIDLGTSGIKAVLIEDLSRVVAVAAEPVAVSRPQVGHSEQDADLWVATVLACLDRLALDAPREMAAVRGIGLSGQMLAALILDADLRPLRPAMLWNDQRALAECAELLAAVPDIGRRTNGTPDPGITAPKLMWLRRHEPQVMDRARMLMLTKDYVRLALTGEVATEPSDAGGTQLLDVASGRWDPALCAAAGWDPAHLPPVVDSWAAAGQLKPALAARWGMAGPVAVAAGAGDNMGSTLGAGGARPAMPSSPSAPRASPASWTPPSTPAPTAPSSPRPMSCPMSSCRWAWSCPPPPASTGSPASPAAPSPPLTPKPPPLPPPASGPPRSSCPA